MAKQQPHPETLRSLAGSALVGPGLFLLFGHLVCAAAQLNRLLNQTPGAGLEVVSSVMLAASFGPHHLWHDLFALLWPPLIKPGPNGTHKRRVPHATHL
jgi:hypothetical protein